MMPFKRWMAVALNGLSILLGGCSSMDVQHYRGNTPEFDLFAYFDGKTYAWGQFQARSGQVERRFKVAISGEVIGNQLRLDERFIYDNGERQTRIWQITRIAAGQYVGRAADVVGEAYGKSAGNALNWRYTLDLPYKNSSIHVQFDDWMFLQTPELLLNRAQVSKWGFKVGEVTLFFSKFSQGDSELENGL
jgi:hypothetical protein